MPHLTGTELLNAFSLLDKVEIQAGNKVADLGCGALGHFVFPAAKLVGPRGVVFAVDIQRRILEQIDRLAKQDQIYNIKPVWADIEKFRAAAIQDSSLDFALLINNLFLIKDLEQARKEMARLTKAGGRLVVVDWKTADTPLGPPLELRVSREKAKRIFNGQLFKFLQEFEPGQYHYGLIFERTPNPAA